MSWRRRRRRQSTRADRQTRMLRSSNLHLLLSQASLSAFDLLTVTKVVSPFLLWFSILVSLCLCFIFLLVCRRHLVLLPKQRWTYLKFVVRPWHYLDFTLVLVERKMRQIERAKRSEVHCWSPGYVAVVLYDCQLILARCHHTSVQTTNKIGTTFSVWRNTAPDRTGRLGLGLRLELGLTPPDCTVCPMRSNAMFRRIPTFYGAAH